MIDDFHEVQGLMEAIEQHLPMRAFATAKLAEAICDTEPKVRSGDVVEVDRIHYLGDDAGIACFVGVWGATSVVVSITHLEIDPEHPLHDRIVAYQERRSKRLQEADADSMRIGSMGIGRRPHRIKGAVPTGRAQRARLAKMRKKKRRIRRDP